MPVHCPAALRDKHHEPGILGTEGGPDVSRGSGSRFFLAFRDVPPADWPKTQVFVTALSLFGLRAFTLDSGEETPGEGGDPEALVQLMARARGASGDDEASGPAAS